MSLPQFICWDVREQVFWNTETGNRTSVEFRAKWYGQRLLFPQRGRPVVRTEDAAAIQPEETPILSTGTPEGRSAIGKLVDSYRDHNPEITQHWRDPEPDAAKDRRMIPFKGFTVHGMPLDRLEPRFHDFLRLFGEPGGVMMTEDKIEVWFLDGSPPLTLTVNRPFQHMRIT